MANNNLRPNLTITQVFTPVTPVVPAAGLPALLIGINRHFEYQTATSLTDWNAGSISANVDFPNWLGGQVASTTDADETLRPKVYVSNSLFGIAEVEDVTYDLSGDPVFTVQAGADATFTVATGTTGVFSVSSGDPTVGSFTDTNADFIANSVGVGDVIHVNGVATYRIHTTGLESDTEANVRRIDKGPGSVSASESTKFYLMPEDSNSVRTLVTTSDSFIAAGGFTGNGVKVNDLVRLDNWTIKKAYDGVQYGTLGDGVGTLAVDGSTTILSTWRKLTFQSAPTPFAVWNNTTLAGTVVFVLNSAGDLVPEFYAATVRMATNLVFYAKDYASGSVRSDDKDENGVVFVQRNYGCVESPGAYGLGTFTAQDNSGERIFTDANLITISGIDVGQHVAIEDTDGVFRPVFEITNIDDIGTGDITVSQFSDSIMDTQWGASGVNYAVLSPTTGVSFVGAEISEVASEMVSAPYIDNYQLSGEERLLTMSPVDTSDLDVGDLIFTDAGNLAFIVTQVPSPLSGYDGSLAVRVHEYSALTLADTDEMTNFGFTVRTAGIRSDFKVRRVVNSSTLEVVETTTTPNSVPDDQMIKGAIYFQEPTDLNDSEDGDDPALIMAPDSSASINYQIKKTLSGANLTGDVLISYSEIRNDDLTVQEITSSNREELLGPAIPANPLSMAASIALQNTPTAIYAMCVETDDITGWTDAFDRVKVDTVYSIVPLTQDASVLSLARVHTSSESDPTNKRERILWQSAAFPRSTTRFTLTDEVATVSRSGGSQTIVIDHDVTEEGTIVGDVVTATAFDGTEGIEFEARITAISVDGQTITTMPSSEIPNPTTVPLTLVAMVINSKTLSDTELRDSIADYASEIQDRRVRNVFPDNITLAFTDDVGIYGGGELTGVDAGGFYMCAMEAAKRARFGPVKPLTKTGGAGIETIVDPFEGNSSDQDVIIDAGTYYMEQPSGAGTNVQAIRALSTNSTDLVYVEDSVTTQIDYFARKLRTQLAPLLGRFILDEGFFTILSAQQGAVVKEILDSKQMKTISLSSIAADETNPDTFRMIYTVEPYFSAARGEISIYI